MPSFGRAYKGDRHEEWKIDILFRKKFYLPILPTVWKIIYDVGAEIFVDQVYWFFHLLSYEMLRMFDGTLFCYALSLRRIDLSLAMMHNLRAATLAHSYGQLHAYKTASGQAFKNAGLNGLTDNKACLWAWSHWTVCVCVWMYVCNWPVEQTWENYLHQGSVP